MPPDGKVRWCGYPWRSSYFGDHNLTREVLDAVVGDRPCLIYDGNFHNACLNSKAIEIISIGGERIR